MKKPTLPAYAPKFSLKPFAPCVDNIKRYGPAPKGYRWREVGENYRPNDLCATDGYWWKLSSASRIEETTYPIATPVKVLVKRDSRGRFAPEVAKKVDLGSEFIRYHGNYSKIACERNLLAIKEVLAAPEDNYKKITLCFTWSTTPQGQGHWESRNSGKLSLSPEDLDYLRAAKEFFEKRIVELTPPAPAPKPPVDIGSRMKAYIHRETNKHDLEWRIERIEGAIGGNTKDILNVFPWAESSQGLGHWDERYNLRARVSSNDLAYLCAVKEFMEARVKELERPAPAPAPTPTVPELQAKISSLEAEVASLRRKIAGAKVTFPE